MNEEETTTVVDVPAEDTGVEETQPVEQEVEEAVETETTTEESTEEEPEITDTSSEEDLSEWATKKGIDLSTPEGQQKALKSMREAEKSFHSKSQEASDLAKQIGKVPEFTEETTQAEQALAIANSLQNQQIVSNWVAQAKVPAEDIRAMQEYGAKDPRTQALVENGLLTLDQYRAIAVASNPIDTEAIKKQGGQEALQSLANKQRATAVKPSASSAQSSTSLTKDNVEQWYSSLGAEGRKNPANQATLERILAS